MHTTYFSIKALAKGLKGEFYSGYFGGNPFGYFNANEVKKTLLLPQIDYDLNENNSKWPDLSPATVDAITTTNYSARISGFITIGKAANYTFYLICDDGGYLWIGETVANANTSNPLIDVGGFHPPMEGSKTIYLKSGMYPLLIAYQNGNGGRALQLQYESVEANISRVAVPNYVLNTHY